MKRFEQEWDEYRRLVYGHVQNQLQLTELRRTFFAGAFACLSLVLKVGDTEDQDDAARQLEALRLEIESEIMDTMLRDAGAQPKQ